MKMFLMCVASSFGGAILAISLTTGTPEAESQVDDIGHPQVFATNVVECTELRIVGTRDDGYSVVINYEGVSVFHDNGELACAMENKLTESMGSGLTFSDRNGTPKLILGESTKIGGFVFAYDPSNELKPVSDH